MTDKYSKEWSKWCAMPGWVMIKQRTELEGYISAGGLRVPGTDMPMRIGEVVKCGAYTTRKGNTLFPAGWLTEGALVQYKGSQFRTMAVGGAYTSFVRPEDIAVAKVKIDGEWQAMPGWALVEDVAQDVELSTGGIALPGGDSYDLDKARIAKLVSAGAHVSHNSGEMLEEYSGISEKIGEMCLVINDNGMSLHDMDPKFVAHKTSSVPCVTKKGEGDV